MHGYLLHDILAGVLAPLRSVSWGTLYPVLRNLEADGLIGQSADPPSISNRKRKVYAITDKGRERFQWSMAKPLAHSLETEDMFRVKLANFHLIAAGRRRQILLQYKVFLELMMDHVQAWCDRVIASSAIDDNHRANILQAMDCTRYSYRARLTWVEEKLAEREEISRT